MNGPSKLIPHHRVFKKSLPLFLRFKITHRTPSSVLLLLLLVIKKLLEFHISQILLYSILQNLQKSLLRLNRRVSRGVRRSSSSASSFAARENKRERENVVGNFVEEKRFTLNAAAKTTTLELGVLSFCL
tara:strand:- start:642 stop:1031 length:390 start_codon:yes stop_codon:yes gene_type:complete